MLHSDAGFSADSVHRYTLTRVWDYSKPKAFLIGLNPSTADHQINDPTVTREIGFARSWGCGALLKGNLFAFRATDPKVMKKAADPVGRDNDEWLLKMFAQADIAVCCWGAGGSFKGRDLEVARLLTQGQGKWKAKPLQCLGTTKSGSPKHPLYLKATTPLVGWTEALVRQGKKPEGVK